MSWFLLISGLLSAFIVAMVIHVIIDFCKGAKGFFDGLARFIAATITALCGAIAIFAIWAVYFIFGGSA